MSANEGRVTSYMVGFQNEYKPKMRRDFAAINCLTLWILDVLRLGMIYDNDNCYCTIARVGNGFLVRSDVEVPP